LLEKRIELEMNILILSTFLSTIFLILRRNEPDKSQIHIAINLKYPLPLPEFKDTWMFPTHCREILKREIIWKSAQWEQKFATRKDRRDKANIRFSQF